jgi:hypothetical protein
LGYIGNKPTAVPLTSADIEDGVISAADLGANSVDSSELVDGSIDTSHLSDDAVTLAKMASGTDGNIISYDASGNPVAIATGNDGQVLTSAGAGQPPAFEAAAGFDVTSITGATALGATPADTDEFVLSDGGVLKRIDYSLIKASNTPAFGATVNSATSVGDNSYTKVQLDTEVLDSDSTYDNSTNYRFTPAVAGKYFIYGMVAVGSGSGVNNAQQMFVAIYKNGSLYQQAVHDGRNNAYGDTFGGTVNAIVDLDADDYVELFATFGGFRIAGV